jgi:hypothetical protein
VIDDRAGRAVVLRDRRPAYGAHMDEQVAGRVDDGLGPAESDDRRMEGDVRIRVLAQMQRGRRVLEFVKQVPQRTNVGVRCVQGREPRGHRFERRPHLDHLDHFALGLANDEDTAPRDGENEPFLLEQRQRLTDGRAAHAERGGQLPFIQAQFLLRIVDVGFRDRIFQERIGLIPQARGIEWTQRERCRRCRPLNEICDGAHGLSSPSLKGTALLNRRI